ncbi:MAG TPA: urease accessory protein UreE [Candidatus Binatia bacterium]|jgi:urease accessory protein|nr:urease accessory protein UreE [Candidatus Binatia bacterium]
MIEITTKIKPGTAVQVLGQLSLPYEQRQKRWLRARLASGEQVALRLRRGETLRGGDLIAASDGRAVEVVAAAEKVLHVECASVRELARAAYHLGNRHAAVQLGHGFLRIIEDAVLEEMLRGLGAKITKIEAPFGPEPGAYGAGHAHPTESEQAQHDRVHEQRTKEIGADNDDGDPVRRSLRPRK